MIGEIGDSHTYDDDDKITGRQTRIERLRKPMKETSVRDRRKREGGWGKNQWLIISALN